MILKSTTSASVEDNWENPTLGAWGLGWEVWLNGMEVTQFLAQQVGGPECKTVGEITYGLDVWLRNIQGVDSVYDLVWSDGLLGKTTMATCSTRTKGAIHLQIEHADVEFCSTASSNEKEAQNPLALENRCRLPT